MKIPVWHPFLADEEKIEISKIINDGYLGMGKTVFDFENSVANQLNCSDDEIVSTHTGASALHVILEAFKLDNINLRNILTPAMNNIADLQSILSVGANPIFCDCNSLTGLIDFSSIHSSNAKKADALIILDYASNKIDIDAARNFCDQHNLILIYDAAHSFGSVSLERIQKADATMFSFDPIKTFTAIDAGIIHSSNQRVLNFARAIRHMGMTQDLNQLKANGRSFDYDVPHIGYRYHLSNVHAAVGIEQIKKKKMISDSRHHILKRMRSGLHNCRIVQDWVPYDCDMIPFMNVALINNEYRDSLRMFLDDNNIQTGIHWKPGNLFTGFAGFVENADQLDQTMLFYSSILSLPLFTGMTDDQCDYVISKILEFDRSIT